MNTPAITTITLNPAIDRTVTIPAFTAGAVNRVEHVSDRAGGKGINVAAALAAAGFKVTVLGFLGRNNEAVFSGFFAARSIEDRCLRLPGSTRVGIKITDPVRQETTDINFPGLTPTTGEMTTLCEQVNGLRDGWCVISGSLPPGVPEGIYRKFVALLKGHGVRTVLDSSGTALREALQAGPDIVKPNVHELEELLGRALPDESSVIAAARELVAGGVGVVAVSRGADGACFVTQDEVVIARPPAVTVHSTVGAGDAMVAGIVAGHLQDLPLAGIARLATAFSLSALTRTGSEFIPAEAFLDRVEIAEPQTV